MKKKFTEKEPSREQESDAYQSLKELIASSGQFFDARLMKAVLVEHYHNGLLQAGEYHSLITFLQDTQFAKLLQLIQDQAYLGAKFWRTGIKSEHIKRTISTAQYQMLLTLLENLS